MSVHEVCVLFFLVGSDHLPDLTVQFLVYSLRRYFIQEFDHLLEFLGCEFLIPGNVFDLVGDDVVADGCSALFLCHHISHRTDGGDPGLFRVAPKDRDPLSTSRQLLTERYRRDSSQFYRLSPDHR